MLLPRQELVECRHGVPQFGICPVPVVDKEPYIFCGTESNALRLEAFMVFTVDDIVGKAKNTFFHQNEVNPVEVAV